MSINGKQVSFDLGQNQTHILGEQDTLTEEFDRLSHTLILNSTITTDLEVISHNMTKFGWFFDKIYNLFSTTFIFPKSKCL